MEGIAVAPKKRRPRICIVATIPLSIRAFMGPHIAILRDDYDVTIVSSGSSAELAELLGDHVRFAPIAIERNVDLRKDISTLFFLWRLFRREKFDAVHSMMPKSGLLAMLAAKAAGIRVRVHTFTGQVWVTRKGLAAAGLKALDRVLASSATVLLADSKSQRRLLIASGIAPEQKIDVLADGSFAGVDLKRFAFQAGARESVRTEHRVPTDGVVFMYLGRLNRDKGVGDLARAFAEVAEKGESAQLFVVGPDEDGAEADITELLRRFPSRVHRVGYTPVPERYLSAADVLCLPSYREGFPNVPLQAAAVGVPTLGSAINGITDAVEDGVTGLLHAPGAPGEIAKGMIVLLADAELRRRLGNAARLRATTVFSEVRLTGAFAEFYSRILPLNEV